ncbi:DUF2764 family protein [Flagellimonas sp. 389]|uniref:DUF2764 family protein n=1 Tax=Flagellimonas sp. 389 TaxID=2835862 RepID=UPI001BD2BE6F|nr:DUF2764 family protein [Flagellimonas sp. 389]MBS9462610.1 DUF2764 family protein [Flagellimonas sp. 389]
MISGDLEYVLVSLPHLSFEDSMETRSRVSFLLKKYAHPSTSEKSLITILEEEAGKFLNPEASRLFREIDLGTIHSNIFQESKNKVLAGFSEFMYELKKELEQLRISRRKEDSESFDKKQRLPFTPGNPLEEELQLLQLQWNKLESLSQGHYSNFTALITYKLKLMLLLRWWSFDMEKGFDLFETTTKKD